MSKHSVLIGPWTIEIDCWPGAPRPSVVLPPLLRSVGLSLDDFEEPTCKFGEWSYQLRPSRLQAAPLEVRVAFGKGLVELYNKGAVRYASW